jgi:predicted Zn-dependent protease
MRKQFLLLSLILIAGCSSGGSGSGGSNLSLGSLIGGRTGEYVDAGTKAGSALTMSDADEDEMGRTIAIAATNQWPLYDRPNLTKYVTLVGLTVADASSRPDGNWVFGVLDTPDIGAYSGPNGYILVTRGAIAAMQDESELAAVLAHEIAHVLNHDGMNAVKNARLTEAGLQGASAADQRAAAFNQLSGQLVNTVLKSGWSQSQETAADSLAIKLLIASGYDPSGLPRFLGRMQERQRGSARPFGTHPGTADRIARTTSQIGGAKSGATNRDRFVNQTADAKL